MPCERIGPYIACTRGRRKAPLCSVCHERPATQLCDGPAPPGRGPSPRSTLPSWVPPTCDAPLCKTCSTHLSAAVVVLPTQVERAAGMRAEADDRDFCPSCAAAGAGAAQPSLPGVP